MDDFVEYKIYNTHLLNVSVDSKHNKSKFIKFGQLLIDDINKLSNNYLWRKDCFQIEPKYSFGARISHFKGTMYYGGDINDEWFVVYLFYQISRVRKNIVVEIVDNDGQFLLIHSAYNLPKWIDPKNAHNRVYIHQNKLHLIPLSYADIINNKIKSIDLILNKTINTLANNDIQHCIDNKLKQFADKIHKNPGINYHSSVVVLTKECANIIKKYPLIISYIVDSFINGYPPNYKRIKIKERKFKVHHNDYVFASVRLTRYLYGMLSFKPLKSVPMYYRKNGFDLNDKKALNGVKLMIGFEILYQKCKQNIGDDNMERDWIKFKKSLIKKGYFRDCIVCSDSYKKKIQNAKTYYRDNMKQTAANLLCVANGVNPNNVSQFCLNAMDNVDNTENVSFAINDLKHDDESWMNITDKDLNEIFCQYQETNQEMLFEEILDDDEVTQQTNDDILSLKENLNTFLDKKSSVDGVEIQHEINGMQFDADRVLNILKEHNNEEHEMKDIMHAMDHELSEKQRNKQEEELNIDLNVVNDILQSHITSQTNGNGLGPAATLLSQIGLHLK